MPAAVEMPSEEAQTVAEKRGSKQLLERIQVDVERSSIKHSHIVFETHRQVKSYMLQQGRGEGKFSKHADKLQATSFETRRQVFENHGHAQATSYIRVGVGCGGGLCIDIFHNASVAGPGLPTQF